MCASLRSRAMDGSIAWKSGQDALAIWACSPAASSTIQTSVGAGVRLSCPMAATASQCQTRACTWTGPGGVRVSGGEQDERLHVEYDRDTCECVLSIRVTSLSHAGVWR